MNAVEGRLHGPEGAPLGGARVLIIGHSGSTVADRDGVFSLDGDIEPPFQLLVTLPDGVALSPVTVEDVPEEGLLEVHLEPIMAEAVTMALAAKLGRLAAHEKVGEACRAAVEQGRHLSAVLAEDAEVADVLSAAELKRLFDPAGYLGEAGPFVDAVTAAADNALKDKD